MTINIYTDGTVDIINKKGLREYLPLSKVSNLVNLFLLLNIGTLDENKNFTVDEVRLRIKNFKFNMCNRKSVNNSIVMEHSEVERFINEMIKLEI